MMERMIYTAEYLYDLGGFFKHETCLLIQKHLMDIYSKHRMPETESDFLM